MNVRTSRAQGTGTAAGELPALRASRTDRPPSPRAREEGREGGLSLRLLPATAPLLKRKELIRTIIAALVVAASYLYPLFRERVRGVTPCFFHLLTGKPCPLCGMTRSFAAAARLHVSEAFWYHLLGPFFFLGLLLYLAFSLYALVSGRSIEFACPRRLRNVAGWFLLGSLLAAWALKLYFFGANV